MLAGPRDIGAGLGWCLYVYMPTHPVAPAKIPLVTTQRGSVAALYLLERAHVFSCSFTTCSHEAYHRNMFSLQLPPAKCGRADSLQFSSTFRYWSWNGGPREGRGVEAMEKGGQIVGAGGAGGGWEWLCRKMLVMFDGVIDGWEIGC